LPDDPALSKIGSPVVAVVEVDDDAAAWLVVPAGVVTWDSPVGVVGEAGVSPGTVTTFVTVEEEYPTLVEVTVQGI
jgi:hypothetical protein